MNEDASYIASRQLRRGATGWFLLAGLGVSYVISGDFAGWNFGIGEAGWGGFVLATTAMAVMYLTLVLTLAELSSAIPTAGAGYSFARQAMGVTGGFVTGLAILIEYALAPAAIVIFIGAATNELLRIDGPWVYAGFYGVFIGIHVIGVGEALRVMLAITGLAVLAILITAVALIGSFDAGRLLDVPSPTGVTGEFLPFGWYGVWAALPFAMWLFLAVEGVPLAAEEANDPAKDVPRGIIVAMLFLMFTAALVTVLLPGAVGAAAIGDSAVPLVDALNLAGFAPQAKLVNTLGLAGLIASFFSIIYGYSRLVFALSRAGYLPRSLSVTSSRHVPVRALVVPGFFGFLMSLSGAGDRMLAMAVVGATVSYALMAASHLILRLRQPTLHRPYRTPGGMFTSGLCLLLSVLALTGVYAYDPAAFLFTMLLFVGGGIYFLSFGRHHLTARTAEEEFALLANAETTLKP
ncbi:MAG: ethanolamine permease [Pseudomonadota bacterium]